MGGIPPRFEFPGGIFRQFPLRLDDTTRIGTIRVGRGRVNVHDMRQPEAVPHHLNRVQAPDDARHRLIADMEQVFIPDRLARDIPLDTPRFAFGDDFRPDHIRVQRHDLRRPAHPVAFNDLPVKVAPERERPHALHDPVRETNELVRPLEPVR